MSMSLKIKNNEQAYTALNQFMMWFDKNIDVKNEILENIKFDVFEYLNREIEKKEEYIIRENEHIKRKMEEKAEERKWNKFVKKYEDSLSDKQLSAIKKYIMKKNLTDNEISLITNPELPAWKMERMAYCIDKGFNEEHWKICFNKKHEQDKVLYLTEAVINKVDDELLKYFAFSETPTPIVGMYVLGIVDKVPKIDLYNKLIAPQFSKREVVGLRNYVRNCYRGRYNDYARPNNYERCTWQLACVIDTPELNETINFAKNLIDDESNIDKKQIEIDHEVNI